MRFTGPGVRYSWAGLALAAAAAAAYCIATPRSGGADGLWVLNSPDAASVQVTAREFSRSGRLEWLPAGDWPFQQSAPRSFTWNGSGWAPGSYATLPAAYGLLWALAGGVPLLWLTPLLGGLGVWLMFCLASRWMGPRTGLAAAALLAVTPAYWYASMQPFTPAVPFVALLMLGAVGATATRPRGWIAGGLALGAALAIRPHEALWVVPAAAVALAGPGGWRRVRWILAGAALPLAAAAWLQLRTYGSVLGSGYSAASAGDGGPFSLSLRAVASNVWSYLGVLHGYTLALAAAGLALALAAREKLGRYLGAVSVAAAGLLLIYGSYVVHDSPGVPEPTIGNSQVRYMLPLLVLLVPLGARLLGRARPVVAAAAVALGALLAYGGVVAAPGDGARDVQSTLAQSRPLLEGVLSRTQPGDLIIAGRYDKLLVGHRPVAFQAATDLAGRLRSGGRAYVLGGQGLPDGVLPVERVDLPGNVALQRLVAE